MACCLPDFEGRGVNREFVFVVWFCDFFVIFQNDFRGFFIHSCRAFVSFFGMCFFFSVILRFLFCSVLCGNYFF